MFSADARTLNRIAPTVKRVLIVDPNPASARLLLDLMKNLGAREVDVEPDHARGMETARDLEPGMIFTERTGAGLDGEAFTKAIRRSHLACRRVPIVMVTSEATATTIKGARDSGVHEFLRKPFTSGDLFKRVENVALKPRDWVEGVAYVGPDRRRFNSGEYTGPQKRQADAPVSAAAVAIAVKDQAMRILAAALAQFDNDPHQAVRAARQQVETLRALAMKTSDTRLAAAATALETVLAAGPTSRTSLLAPISLILALADPVPLVRTG